MAADYSYNELMQMQEQAIRRVREMQQRARAAAQGDDITEVLPEPMPEPEPEPVTELPEPENIGNRHEPRRNAAPKSNSPLAGISALLEKLPSNEDSAVILPIILLLLREGADEKLLLALLYIMT